MKIIIIGNGYDLNLGLKSRFGDFYSSFYKIKNNEWDYERIRLNIWSLLLYFKYINGCNNGIVKFERESPRWMDVEGFICSVLNNSDFYSLLNSSFQDRTHYVQAIGKIGCDSIETQTHEIKSLIQIKKREFGTIDIYTLLFEDLKLFESHFMDYLDSAKVFNYSAKSDALMSKITNDFQNTYVISFNYTNLPNNLKGVNQVHGSLEKRNIIIGVDKTTIKSKNMNKMRFSKSWRQLSGVINTSALPSKNDVTEIVVFGHSLGSQDYSYFHSLFNYYDIYSNNVKLTFLYADYHYDSNTKLPDLLKDEEYRISYIDSVYNLLNNYVEKSLGQKEADSFITKMQLEGRLSVEEITEYWCKNVR